MAQVPDVPLGGLYGDLILDHYRSARNRAPVFQPDIEAEEFNSFCGDRVTLQLRLDAAGHVVQVGAQSEGCSIIQATASMMSETLLGRRLDELDRLGELFRGTMRGNGSFEASTALGSLQALTVVRQFPVRIKCALLPWVALEEGIKTYRSGRTGGK